MLRAYVQQEAGIITARERPARIEARRSDCSLYSVDQTGLRLNGKTCEAKKVMRVGIRLKTLHIKVNRFDKYDTVKLVDYKACLRFACICAEMRQKGIRQPITVHWGGTVKPRRNELASFSIYVGNEYGGSRPSEERTNWSTVDG